MIDQNQDNKVLTHKKKRIKRIKNSIILTVLVMMILPIVLCVILFFKINDLEKQVELLSENKIKNKEAIEVSGNFIKEVHAAEKVDDEQVLNNNENIMDEFEENNIDIIDIIEDNLYTHTDNNEDANVQSEDTDTMVLLNDESTKKVYLTFDDGPSSNTLDILNILEQYDVKATFFVIGKTDEVSKSLYKEIVDRGHTIAMHSYSHRYNIIYNSVSAFEKDIKKLRKLLLDTTGIDVKLYRFPGGSSNLVNKVSISEFIKYLDANDYIYYDWNVSNGDATSNNLTKNELVQNVLKDVKKFNTSIVLMHDTNSKSTTVESLPTLIEELIKLGVSILPLDETVKPIQHIKVESVR